MDIQQNNVAVLHFNLVNQDGSTIFIRKTKLATFNLINPSEVSVPITDIGFDATLNQCWVRIPKESNATTGQYSGVLNIVDDDWGTYTTSKIKVYSVVSDADKDTKSVVFTATCLATQVINPSGGNSPYYNTTTSTWWQYSDTLKAFEDTGVGNLIKYITKNVQHLKDGTGNGSIVTCLDDEISANNIATGLCSTDLGKNNDNSGESCVALGENNYIAEGVSNATAIAGAQPSAVDVFAIGDKTAGHKNIFTINKFGDIYFRPDSSLERIAILQGILDGVIKNVVYDSSNYSLTVTFYSASDNANKTKTYDLSGLKAVLKDDAVKEISVNQSTAVMTVNTINGSSQQIQLPNDGVKSFVRTFQEASPVCFDAVTDQDGTTKTLFSPALFMKEPQTSLVLDNVYTGNSGGQTEYFKWFYDQYHITEDTSSAMNTFFNLPIDFATKPDCTPFDSSHVIVPTLSCVNGALDLYQKKLTAGTNITITDAGVISASGGNVQSNWSTTDTSSDSYILNKPTKLSSFTNDSGYDTVTSVNSKVASCLPLAGGTLTGYLKFSDSGISGAKGLYGTVGGNDYWRLIGGASAIDSGWLELATADDGTEPIYVRQYVGTYPNSNFTSIAHSATLLDASGNTSFPGTVTASAFSGNASSATKLNTARNIGLSGVTATTKSFDGTADITIPITAVPATLLTGTASISTTGNAATATKATQDGSGNVITSTYLPISGGTLTGNLIFSDPGPDTTKGIYGTVGGNDAWRLIGGSSAIDSGWLELATANNGTEPIYVRQYGGTHPNSDFADIIRSATLLDASGNTSFPGDLHCGGDIYYKKSVLTADISSGVLNIGSLTKFIKISTSHGTIDSINNTSTGYSAGDEITLYGTFTYNVDCSSLNVTDGALKIVYTGTDFVRLY